MALLMVVNFFSYMQLYTGEEPASVRHEWYSLQRSNKWWLGIYQLQMIGATLFIAYGYPTILTNFLTYFGWFNFIIPTSFATGDRVPANSTNYNTLAYPAAIYLGYAGIEFEYLAVSVIIIWLVISIAFSLGFTIVMVIVSAIRGGNIVETILTRPVYIFLRMLNMAMFSFALFGGLSITHYDQAGPSGPIGIILLIICGIYLFGVLIFFILIHVQQNIKGLYQPGSKGRFLFLYGHLKKEAFFFAFVSLLQRFLVGFLIGAFYSAPVGQLVSIIAVSIIFIPIFWLTDHHADVYQKYAEIGVNICNVIAFAILFGLSGSQNGIIGNGAGSTVVAVLYIVVMCCSIGVVLVFFFFNWFQKEEQFSFNQIKNLILCKTEAG